WKRLAMELFPTHGKTIDDERRDGCRLFQVVFQDLVKGINVGVRGACVVAFHIVPDPLETRQANFIKRHVIGGADAGDGYGRSAEVLNGSSKSRKTGLAASLPCKNTPRIRPVP